MAVKPSAERSPTDSSRTSGSDPAYGCRKSALGPTTHPGRTGELGIFSFGKDSRQIYGLTPRSRAVLDLATVSEAARIQHMGVRLLLRPTILFEHCTCFSWSGISIGKSCIYSGQR